MSLFAVDWVVLAKFGAVVGLAIGLIVGWLRRKSVSDAIHRQFNREMEQSRGKPLSSEARKIMKQFGFTEKEIEETDEATRKKYAPNDRPPPAPPPG